MQLIETIRRIGRPRIPRRAIRLAELTIDANTRRQLFLPPDYVERLQPDYYPDSPPTNVVYQPDVYSLARRLAAKSDSSRLVDVGCGTGEKLVAAGAGLETVGIDFGLNLERAQEAHPDSTWIAQDLGTARTLPLLPPELEDSVVICADVIEHLVDPGPLLEALAGALASASAVIVSTPDRNRLSGGVRGGPPANPSHVREWTRDEFARLLRDRGFGLGVVSYTRPHTGTLARSTILAVLVPERNKMLLGRAAWPLR